MKGLSKKVDTTLLVISVMVAILGAVLIFFSASLLNVLESFIETKVLHREFNLLNWLDTINTLLAFPICIVICVDAVLFIKFSDKTKTILLLVYAAIVLFFIAFFISRKNLLVK